MLFIFQWTIPLLFPDSVLMFHLKWRLGLTLYQMNGSIQSSFPVLFIINATGFRMKSGVPGCSSTKCSSFWTIPLFLRLRTSIAMSVLLLSLIYHAFYILSTYLSNYFYILLFYSIFCLICVVFSDNSFYYCCPTFVYPGNYARIFCLL